MVVTRRRTRMDSEKNKNSNGVKRTGMRDLFNLVKDILGLEY